MSETTQLQKRRMIVVPEEELERILEEIRELKALLQQSGEKSSPQEKSTS